MIYAARRLPDNGLAAWDVVKERGYEGFVAKDAESVYRGGPTRSWIKGKIRREGRFVVARADAGRRSDVLRDHGGPAARSGVPRGRLGSVGCHTSRDVNPKNPNGRRKAPGCRLRHSEQINSPRNMSGRHQFPDSLLHALTVNIDPDTRTRHAELAAGNGFEFSEQGGGAFGVHSVTLLPQLAGPAARPSIAGSPDR